MTNSSVFDANSIECRYELIRNITTDTQKDSNISTYVGVIKSDQILSLPDDENVRRFLGNKAKVTGKVQQAILRSLEERRDEFSLLNGGITIVAKALRIDNSSNRLLLIEPSIINGSQSRGVMSIYHEDSENIPVPIKFELIVSNDTDLVADISIARNFQTNVKAISIAGRKGAFDPLNEALEKSKYSFLLNEDESDTSGIAPTLAIQIAFLLMPRHFWKKYFKGVLYKKSSVYSSTSKWLTLYSDIFDKSLEKDNDAIEVMNYFKQIIPFGLHFYFEWQKSPNFKGFKIQNGITRDKDTNEIIKVVNGWIFPIIAGHAPYIIKGSDDKWILELPQSYDPKKLIDTVNIVYKQKPDVNALGKNQIGYDLLDRED